MTTTICICLMSFVDRVMSEAVENLSNSALGEALDLASKTARAGRARSPAAIRAERKPAPTVEAAEMSVRITMSAPM